MLWAWFLNFVMKLSEYLSFRENYLTYAKEFE